MKRTTQLSIVVEHRRVAFSITGAADTGLHPSAGDGPGETGLEPAKAPPVCPECGVPWIAVTAPAGEFAASGAAAIDRALQQHGLHTRLSPGGQLSICSKSFERIRLEEPVEKIKESR